MNKRLVTHFIAGYPSLEGSFEIAKGLIDGGVYALEIQIPFSDPSADGPVIEEACQNSLSQGFRVEDGFKLVKRVREYSPETPIYIMSYASVAYTIGLEVFVKRSKELGVKGLIIPDLTVGSDEGLYSLGKKHGVDIVPVLVTTVPDDRLNEILESSKPDWVYIALRGGITGTYTRITDENITFLNKVKSRGVKIMAGFGIQSREQIEVLDNHVDASVIGSFLVKETNRAIKDNRDLKESISQSVKALI